MMLSLVVFSTLKPRGRETPERPSPARAAAGAPAGDSGGLAVMATPFARIVSITELSSGRSVPLEKDATTPRLVSPLVPGSYRVVLTCPSLEQTVSRDISVPKGRPVLVSESFLSPVALLETLR
jgi:hypothetical protein